jgi:hypothetical protein
VEFDKALFEQILEMFPRKRSIWSLYACWVDAAFQKATKSLVPAPYTQVAFGSKKSFPLSLYPKSEIGS